MVRRRDARDAARPVRALPAHLPQPPGLEFPFELKLETLLRVLVDQAAEQVELPCGVALRDQEGGPIRIRAVSSGGDQRFVGMEVDVQSFLGRIVTEGMPMVEPVVRGPLVLDRGDRRRRPTGGAGVPLAAGARVYGALFSFGEPAVGAREALARLDPLAKSHATLLLSGLEIDVARQRAETDPLTELPNRRAFDRALVRASRGPLALVALDIDHFKRVNDTYGHPFGDKVLRGVASVLGKGIRKGDTVGRYGGEEFVLYLHMADTERAREGAERFCRKIRKSRFAHKGKEIAVTASFGVACAPHHGTGVEELLKHADEALYLSKQRGRDRVTVYPG